MHSRLRITAFILLLSLATLSPSSAKHVSGKVVSVTDGDTIKALIVGKAEKVRLCGIDALEKSRASGTKAKQFSSVAAFGKTVTVNLKDKELQRLQGETSVAHRGLWREIKQISPWEFRKGKTTVGGASEGKRL